MWTRPQRGSPLRRGASTRWACGRTGLVGLLVGAALLLVPIRALEASQRPAASERPTAAAESEPPAVDPRIRLERVTESDPPPPPREIVQPIPAIHRIAAEHSPLVHLDAERHEKALAAMQRGLAFLASVQAPSGAWMANATATPTDEPERPEPVTVAITALAVKAFAQAQRDGDEMHPALRRGVRLLLAARGPEGEYGGGAIATYVHSCIVMGLAAVDGIEAAEAVRDAVAFLRSTQWDDGEGFSPRQDWYGGAGYGRHGRPDLSNTQMMLDALHDAGISPDDPAVQRAVTFISRTQNLRATNAAAWAQAGPDDGGFIYTPANGGESFASEAAGEGRSGELIPEGAARSLRSYGSMTYAGFKSLLYAGLPRDDVRVRAAYDWIRRHLTFDENPGLGLQGLYYYRHAMARALHAAQQPTIEPISSERTGASDGAEPGNAGPTPPRAINWRAALVDALVRDQREDGSWINAAERWMEGSAPLTTIYAVLALQESLK